MASDFHTHDPAPAIRALISSSSPLPGRLTSLEVHPWYLPDRAADFRLPECEELERFDALGEIGLDKLCGCDYTLQKQYFGVLLELAADCHKPVVIHSVRSFQEIFAELKRFPMLKVMFHGFRSSPEMLDELWKRGITVSFHPQMVNSPEIMAKIVHASGAYGFESDDNRNISLVQLLAEAEKISGIKGLEKITDQYFDDFLEN